MTSFEAPPGWSIKPSAILIDPGELNALAGRLDAVGRRLGGMQRPPSAPALAAPCVDLGSLVSAATASFSGVASHLGEMAAQLRRRARFVPPESYPFVASTVAEGSRELAQIIREAKSNAQREALFNRLSPALLDDARVAKEFFKNLGASQSYDLISHLHGEDFQDASQAFAAATKEGLSSKFYEKFVMPDADESERDFEKRVDTLLRMTKAAGGQAFGDKFLVALGTDFLDTMNYYSSGFRPFDFEATELLLEISESHSASAKLLRDAGTRLLGADHAMWGNNQEGLGGKAIGAILASAGQASPALAREAIQGALEATSYWGVLNENVAKGVTALIGPHADWLSAEVIARLQPDQSVKSEALLRNLTNTLVSMRHWSDQRNQIYTDLVDSVIRQGTSTGADAKRLGKMFGFIDAVEVTTTYRQVAAGEDAEAIRRSIASGATSLMFFGAGLATGGVGWGVGLFAAESVTSGGLDHALGGDVDDVKSFFQSGMSAAPLSGSEKNKFTSDLGIPPANASEFYEGFTASTFDARDLKEHDFMRYPYQPVQPLVPQPD